MEKQPNINRTTGNDEKFNLKAAIPNIKANQIIPIILILPIIVMAISVLLGLPQYGDLTYFQLKEVNGIEFIRFDALGYVKNIEYALATFRTAIQKIFLSNFFQTTNAEIPDATNQGKIIVNILVAFYNFIIAGLFNTLTGVFTLIWGLFQIVFAIFGINAQSEIGLIRSFTAFTNWLQNTQLPYMPYWN